MCFKCMKSLGGVAHIPESNCGILRPSQKKEFVERVKVKAIDIAKMRLRTVRRTDNRSVSFLSQIPNGNSLIITDGTKHVWIELMPSNIFYACLVEIDFDKGTYRWVQLRSGIDAPNTYLSIVTSRRDVSLQLSRKNIIFVAITCMLSLLISLGSKISQILLLCGQSSEVMERLNRRDYLPCATCNRIHVLRQKWSLLRSHCTSMACTLHGSHRHHARSFIRFLSDFLLQLTPIGQHLWRKLYTRWYQSWYPQVAVSPSQFISINQYLFITLSRTKEWANDILHSLS